MFPRGVARGKTRNMQTDNEPQKPDNFTSLATGQSDHLEDLVMFEGGAAAKCARPSWISHRSAWRTATKKKLTGTTGIIVPFGPLTLRTVSRASTTATSRLMKRTR